MNLWKLCTVLFVDAYLGQFYQFEQPKTSAYNWNVINSNTASDDVFDAFWRM